MRPNLHSVVQPKMKIAMLIVLFFLVSAFFIISHNNLALGKSENIDEFFSIYTVWVSKIVDNSRSLVGNVVKMEWLPDVD